MEVTQTVEDSTVVEVEVDGCKSPDVLSVAVIVAGMFDVWCSGLGYVWELWMMGDWEEKNDGIMCKAEKEEGARVAWIQRYSLGTIFTASLQRIEE